MASSRLIPGFLLLCHINVRKFGKEKIISVSLLRLEVPFF